MKTKYTKRQIQNAIKYWQKVLERMQMSESMNESNLKDIAENINADLKALSAKKLYVTANFFSASDSYPDRIVVEGIKNLRSTGKFTNDDILQVRTAIKKHFSSKTLEIKENLSDRSIYIAVITTKRV